MKKYSGSFLRVRNLEKYQHYKDRTPPWIKLHQELLEDYDFARLQDASKAHAICIMLLASRLDNRIPADPAWIAKKINATSKVHIESLLSLSFLELYQDASNLLQESHDHARPEGEVEGEKSRAEIEGEKARLALAELNWRVDETWAAHLDQRSGFYADVDGRVPSVTPTLTEEIRGAIIESLRRHDASLLGPESREAWALRSKTRAAGIGLFLDRWCTATDPKNDIRTGGTRYLEPWRPWKRQQGKGDPVEKFAQLYFSAKRTAA